MITIIATHFCVKRNILNCSAASPVTLMKFHFHKSNTVKLSAQHFYFTEGKFLLVLSGLLKTIH